jgi:DnaJ-class molecular chaperone
MKLKAMFFVVCLVAGSLVGYALAAGADLGPATIKIDINGKGKATKAFPHKKHQEMPDLKDKCITCHHTTKKAGDKVEKCGACHTDPTKADAKTKAPGFKKAMHKNCQDCHKKKDKAKAKCKVCHG